MKKPVFLFLALAAFSSLSVSAQPDPYYHTTSVAWIIRTRNNISVDDHYVTLVGHVTARIGDSGYWFTDGTGSVRLDADDFDLPIGRRIIIGGRIDQAYLGFGHLEVDVRRWRYAPVHHPKIVQKNTTTTVTRSAPSTPAPVTPPPTVPAPTAPPLAPPPGQ